MRPITPEQNAQCYGAFVADINTSGYEPLTPWLSANLPDISTTAKLNKPIFDQYPPTIKPLPKKPHIVSTVYSTPKTMTGGGTTVIQGSDDRKGAASYNSAMDILYTGLVNDLKFALNKAEVDPTQASKIIESLKNTKPQPIKDVR
jgi:hypothetical protein